jgi:peptide/nickel transport system substrate-binding protein
MLDPANRGATQIGYVDKARIRTLDARTVRVGLKEPNVSFPEDIAEYYMGVVPEGYDPRRPVGTGPFQFKSFTPGERSVFTRNENYWQKGKPYVDELVIINIGDDSARVNALLGGQVDAISNLPASQVNTVKSNPGLRVLDSETGGWTPITMRVDQAPFSDPRVRQAFRLIVDREQIVGQALSGFGRVANDLYSPYDPHYDTDLSQRKQDLEQAKSLLKQAGRSNLRVDLRTAPVYVGVVESAQVFAEQAKSAGVDVRVRRMDSGAFYGDNYLRWTFAQDFWGTRNYLPQVAQGSMPDSPYNETHWNDPEFKKLIAQARGTVDDAKRGELLRAAQKIEHERGGHIIWGYFNLLDAYSAKLSGLKSSKLGYALNGYNFRDVGFAA